jgi:anti-sigma B factor antagonist
LDRRSPHPEVIMPPAVAAHHRQAFVARRTGRPPPPFTVDTRIETASVALVAPSGELDIFTAPDLRDAMQRVSDRAAVVILDLRGLTFCDTTGVHVVDEAHHTARARGARLVVVPPPHPADAVFDLTGIGDHLDFATDPATITDGGWEAS